MVMVPFKEGIAIRAYKAEDNAYVARTWLLSHSNNTGMNSRAMNSRANASELMGQHRRLIDCILSKDGVTVKVACSETMPDTLVGWACSESDFLHFAYVMPALREIGLARELIRAALGSYPASIDVSHALQRTRIHRSNRFRHNRYLLIFNDYRRVAA